MSKGGGFLCVVCGATFHLTPRLERWLRGAGPPGDALKANMCWVCTRLRSSVEAEAAQMAEALKECDGPLLP
jgi:hypothetical protein